MNSIRTSRFVKLRVVACLLLPVALFAQDYSSTDAFGLSDRGPARRVPRSSSQPLGAFLLERFTTTSEESRFKAKNVGYTYGREDRLPNVPAAFNMEIDRHELRMEFAQGSTKVWPSIAWTNGEGKRGTTSRESTVTTPGITYSAAPDIFNAAGGEVSVGLIVLYGTTDQIDRLNNGSVVTTDKRQLYIIPGLKYLRYFKFKDDPNDAKHEFTLDGSYTRRGTRSKPSDKVASSSVYGYGSIMAKFKFSYDDDNAVEISATWDIPIHEKQPGGQANEGDGNSTLMIGYSRKFGKQITASVDYRRNFDDEFNDIRRIQARVKLNF